MSCPVGSSIHHPHCTNKFDDTLYKLKASCVGASGKNLGHEKCSDDSEVHIYTEGESSDSYLSIPDCSISSIDGDTPVFSGGNGCPDNTNFTCSSCKGKWLLAATDSSKLYSCDSENGVIPTNGECVAKTTLRIGFATEEANNKEEALKNCKTTFGSTAWLASFEQSKTKKYGGRHYCYDSWFSDGYGYSGTSDTCQTYGGLSVANPQLQGKVNAPVICIYDSA